MSTSSKQHSRTTICFIHGWGFDSQIFSGLAAELSAERNTLLIDMPGYGNNRPDTLPKDIEGIADHLISVIPQNSVLAGWSLGGMLSIKIAHKFRDRIKAIILLASTPCFVKKQDWLHGIEQPLIQNMKEHLSSNVEEVLQEFAGLTARGDRSTKQTLRELRLILKSNQVDAGALLTGLDILRHTDLRKEFSGIKCNMMMLLGKRDQLIASGTGNASTAIYPLLQLYEIEAAGHAPFISNKKESAEIISKYLYSIDL
jgi:pimeloyl-[acyl-carrier protein] methyl ester esterase